MSLDCIRLFTTRLHCATPCRGQVCVIPGWGSAWCGIAAAGKLKLHGVCRNHSMAVDHDSSPLSEMRADSNSLSAGSETRADIDGVSTRGLVLSAEAVHVATAAAALRRSEVVAVPTDTLYGFACDARSGKAIQKIYNIKGRSATKPLAICVGNVEDVELYGTVTDLPKGLLGALFPGPVTLILPRGDSSLLDKSLNPGLGSIGVRIPDDHFIRSLCTTFGGALALTSANLSNQPSTVSVEEFRHLWAHCSVVFDAGLLPPGRAGSTIVDLTEPGTYRIVRDGSALQETKDVLRNFGLTGKDNSTAA
jgi:tRNA threonylcarbamoyl adenosine modification protein (Sua5/YciO/YrdC/YwlC family)